jgi:hypothetical protein
MRAGRLAQRGTPGARRANHAGKNGKKQQAAATAPGPPAPRACGDVFVVEKSCHDAPVLRARPQTRNPKEAGSHLEGVIATGGSPP